MYVRPRRRSATCADVWQNSALGAALVFGGYSPTLPTSYTHQGSVDTYSYYADTFLFASADTDEAAPRWQHVLTRGFPTYRAQATLLSDPDNGAVYLFGGYVNNEYIPSRRRVVARTFADVWRLRLDMPGGGFAGVDVAEEARTAAAGPWQRCFTCGSAGRWRKCGGACGGRAFFCEDACLKVWFACSACIRARADRERGCTGGMEGA
jgi:hypothetical protein